MILALLQPIQKLRLLQILFTSSMIYTMAESNPRLNLFILNDMKFSHQIEKSSVITIDVKRHFIVHPINLTNSTYSCREKAYLGTSIVRGSTYIYSISVYCCTYVILLALLARVWLCLNLASCLILLWTTGSILLWNQRNHICSTFSYNQYIQL